MIQNPTKKKESINRDDAWKMSIKIELYFFIIGKRFIFIFFFLLLIIIVCKNYELKFIYNEC
jgi:hypothetical protein